MTDSQGSGSNAKCNRSWIEYFAGSFCNTGKNGLIAINDCVSLNDLKGKSVFSIGL